MARPRRGLFRTKSIDETIANLEANEGPALKRQLGPLQLILMGVGVTIGAGIFVITGTAAAQFAGPSIVLSFVIASVGCGFAALCYAEFASLMPVSGSAYSYAYATLGEVIAWVIGWNLIMEYVFAGSYIAVGWSGYCASLLHSAGVTLPAALSAAPIAVDSTGLKLTGSVINLPAIVIALVAMLVARRGIGVSAAVNATIVALKVGVLVLFLICGAAYVRVDNWRPFIPPNTGHFGQFGLSGVLRGAAVVFVAYLGFDAVSTTAQETRRPQRDLPIGILGSLAICTVLYVAVSLVLTGLTSYHNLDVPNPLSVALRAVGGRLDFLTPFVDLAAVCGLASVLLVLMLAQPRILLAMGRDGLLPAAFGAIHPKFHTPSFGTVVAGCAVMVLSGLFPIDVLVQLVSLGTLTVFIAVCAGVIVLRRTRPELVRPFKNAPGSCRAAYRRSGMPLPAGWITEGVLGPLRRLGRNRSADLHLFWTTIGIVRPG